jgi:hypothetical protein
MLGPSNIAKMNEDTARIVGELDEFVKTWSSQIGHPVRSLVASEGMIQWI